MAYDKPTRDVEERPKRFRKDPWYSNKDALVDNTKIIRLSRWRFFNVFWCNDFMVKKWKYIEKIKKMILRRKAKRWMHKQKK